MVRYSIAALWFRNQSRLPGLTEDGQRSIYYWNKLGENLCASCATDIYAVWLEQGQECASTLTTEQLDRLSGEEVYSPEVPAGYGEIWGGPTVQCDRCEREV